jgi:hypothetical protein
MIRVFFSVLGAGVLLALLGLLYLGAFPPAPPTHHVRTVLPNGQFQTR